MPKHTAKLAILFADICGSTKLYDQLGDELARRLVASCIACMVAELAANQGTLIKTIGDEIMCTFPSAEQGLWAASAMQCAVKKSTFEGGVALHIRIGFHYGEVICEEGDVFGDTVNVAARVAGAARANQIMTTQSVVNALPLKLQAQTHQIMSAEFKGKDEQYLIYLVSWGKEDEDEQNTSFLHAPVVRNNMSTANELVLRYGNKQLVVNKNCNSVIFGRADDCDVVVQNSYVSRQHARFEHRFGKFVVVDQSTNGTFIRPDNGSVIRITREEMILQGKGFISLGLDNFDDPSNLIEFSLIANLKA
jgi:class 3 adenylate cyclase